MTAIVTGISGQDGHYMANFLVEQGHEVIGLTSGVDKIAAISQQFAGKAVRIEAFDFDDRMAFRALLRRQHPTLVFNFAAKATGVGMFSQPLSISRINGEFVLDILEAIREVDPAIGFCQASSAEMYGDAEISPQDELTPFRPQSPYGAAKLYGHNLINVYRRAFGLKCSSAILYNHESVRRTTHFVTRKVAHAAAAIKLGIEDSFTLGGITAMRDWGYAPEYVQAMYLMATQVEPRDYVVATGKLTSVEELCDIAFAHVGLEYGDYLEIGEALARRVETTNLCGNPAAIARDLGWKAQKGIEEIMIEMVDYDLADLS